MKHSYILLLCITGLSIIQCSQSNTDQNFNPQVAMVQNNIDNLIVQANLDPLVEQALIAEIANLSQQANANIQQDMEEIKVAAALTTILESAQKMIKTNPSMETYTSLLSGLKYSARANTIQKLLTGAYPGRFKDELYYTDPYTETIGFTLNDYFFNTILATLITIITPTSFGIALALNSTSKKQAVMARIAAGLAAHCSWLLQKKFIIAPLKQTQ